MWVFELVGVLVAIVIYDIFFSDIVKEKRKEILKKVRAEDLDKEIQ